MSDLSKLVALRDAVLDPSPWVLKSERHWTEILRLARAARDPVRPAAERCKAFHPTRGPCRFRRHPGVHSFEVGVEAIHHKGKKKGAGR